MTICLLFKLKVNFFDNYDILGEIAKYKCKLFFGPDSMGERGSPKSVKCFLRSLWMAPASVDLPNDFLYPSMQHLGEDLVTVLDQLRIKYCIGLGDGAGSNIIGKTFL